MAMAMKRELSFRNLKKGRVALMERWISGFEEDNAKVPWTDLAECGSMDEANQLFILIGIADQR